MFPYSGLILKLTPSTFMQQKYVLLNFSEHSHIEEQKAGS